MILVWLLGWCVGDGGLLLFGYWVGVVVVLVWLLGRGGGGGLIGV